MDLTNAKVRLILAITCLVIFGIGVGLCLYWYDWKLLVILVVLQTSWNIDNQLKSTRKDKL